MRKEQKTVKQLKRINKSEFVSIAAKTAGLPVEEMQVALDAILVNIPELAKQGVKVSFMNFGTFYLQPHKGHPVNFENGEKVIDDYMTFKFSPSNVLTSKIRANTNVSVKQ